MVTLLCYDGFLLNGLCLFTFEQSKKKMKVTGSEGGNEDGLRPEGETTSGGGSKATEEKSQSEPPKDYIHVRARRGQATDRHSLAERVYIYSFS